jgi:Thioredoxin domain
MIIHYTSGHFHFSIKSSNMGQRNQQLTARQKISDMDEATTRTIRIGKASIGLIGLDVALNQAAAEGLAEEEAVAFLFDAVSRQNYIPPGVEKTYRDALRRTYRQHLHPGEQHDEVPMIRIFGKKCVSCDNLQEVVRDVLNAEGLAADIEKIHDPDEIGRCGILITPAVVINGRLLSSGSWPTRAQIEKWIRELTEKN